jgi:O-succinylbenzoic acid--CoA ligase
MERPLTYLKQRADEDLLIGYDSRQFFQLSEQLFSELTQQANQGIPPKILLAEQHPLRFLAAFLAAVAAGCPVFLCNPNWVQKEWQQVFELVQPDLIFGQEAIGNFPIPHSPLPITHYPLPNQIMIPTGGSSGKIRFAVHTWETLMASVRGFYQYFDQKPVNSFCVLPLYHVSGLMQFLRSFTTGGQMVILPFKALVAGEGQQIDPKSFFISLVPTQLARLITSDSSAWLSRFQTVLLGGAPAWAQLLEQARRHRIPLAPTYGMTETASQVVTLKPEAFLAGNNSCGQVLPHAQVTIRSSTGEILGANQTGIITIQGDSLTLGYYPEVFRNSLNLLTNQPTNEPTCQRTNLPHDTDVTDTRIDASQSSAHPCSHPCRAQPSNPPTFQTDDLGFFDEQGYLTLVGRSSNKIITGGENVFPAEVEAAIQATQLVVDVCVTGVPDLHWGQAITAVYVPQSEMASTALLQTAVKDKLSKYKQPKYWVPVDSLPRNSQGKVNYEQLQTIVMAWLETQKSSSSQLG